MALLSFSIEALGGLRSKEQLDLLDCVDCLRSQGMDNLVSLPQIIVCGDQSSGKSSVLEAISGVSFPIKSNLCTRFPTELVLRKTSHAGVTVSIVPHHSSSESKQNSLKSFREELDDIRGLPILIEKAKEAMGISDGRAFSKNLLRVEVSGPNHPHLTIVDLPGLIHSETKEQSSSDIKLVRDVVQGYMKQPRSIILAVVSAKNDYANQIVLNFARKADKTGNRTLGVITKPDTLLAGSRSERTYVSLARNEEVKLHHGWHVLRNMDSETGKYSLADRDIDEKEFFSQGIWGEFSGSLLGVDSLRDRLSKVLLGQIAAELPNVMKEIEMKSDVCINELNKLGEPRATLTEQRLYLLNTSQSFQSLVKAAADGTYNDPFFEDAKTEPGYQKRIRAVIQNLNFKFAEEITTRGHRQEVTDLKGNSCVSRGVIAITRDEYIDQIQNLMNRTRGRELPGTFNPMIVADLFREQSTPWEAITHSHIEKVWKAAKKFLSLTATHIADAATSRALFQKIFQPALKQLLETLNTKTAELLLPHQNGHPITYNSHFIENYQKVRDEWKRDEFSKILKDFFNVPTLKTSYIAEQQDLKRLLDNLVKDAEPEFNRSACSEALHAMEAYYEVALKRFIDDIANEVIEAKLISPLGDIFSPVTVSAMSADMVARIAGESEETSSKREQLTKQLDVLMKGSETCKRFIGVRVLDSDAATTSDPRFENLSVNDEPSDSDETSNASSPDDVRSLTDILVDPEPPLTEAAVSVEAFPAEDEYCTEAIAEVRAEDSEWRFTSKS